MKVVILGALTFGGEGGELAVQIVLTGHSSGSTVGADAANGAQ